MSSKQEIIEPFHIVPDLCPSQIATGILSLWGAGARNKSGGLLTKEEVAQAEQVSDQVVAGTTPAKALLVQAGEIAINADISKVNLLTTGADRISRERGLCSEWSGGVLGMWDLRDVIGLGRKLER